MKAYSRKVFLLLVLTATLLAMAASAQERAPVKPIKRTPTVILSTKAKVTPTPSPTPKIKIKLPREIPTGILFPTKSEEPEQNAKGYSKMPRVVGQPIDYAKRVVQQRQPNARINSAESLRHNPDYRVGAVVSQFPKEDTDLKPGDEVRLLYNPQQQQAPRSVRMPDFTGFDYVTAERRLIALSLNIRVQRGVARSHNPNYRVDLIVNQMPFAGEELVAGSQVILYLNPSPFPRMPNLVGMDILSAQAKLSGEAPNYSQRSIEESEFNPRFAPGVVVNQIPRAGSELRPPGVAVMYYNPQQPKVTVPDVMGLTVPDAVSKIEQNNLVARWPPREDPSSYRITGQSPSAGTVVDARSVVTLRIAAAVVVPDLRRSLLDEAQQTISQNRLTVGTVTTRISSARQDQVISQSPAPNSVVVEGTAINLVIAKTEQVSVPNVLNSQQGNAEQLIANARLVVGQVTTQQSTVAAGTVLSQTPSAGTLVNVATQVSFVVAVPIPTPTPTVTPPPVTPTSELFVVPDLKDKELTEAIRLVRRNQLEVGEISREDPKETASFVLKQQPEAGQLVAASTRVNVVIGKKPVETPPVWPKVLLVGAFGFAALFLARLWKRFRPKPGSEPTQQPAATLSFRTTMNAGVMEFAASTDLQTSFALRFLPKADWGQQYITLTGGLVAAESEER